MSDSRHLVALLGLSGMGPRRLTRLLGHFGSARAAWRALETGALHDVDLHLDAARHAELVARWRKASAAVAVDQLLPHHLALGIDVIDPSHPDWPDALVHDPDPPRLLFCRGDRSLLERVSVAVVGTRRGTALGRSVARSLGHDLTVAGVVVVSGLALGIDGHAHLGAVAAGGPALGVVATGLDVVYPARHRALWHDVATHGLLVSEVPAGVQVERWRFPARNRIMAALADLVVVVESPRSGGSMRTVDSAIDRQTPVFAVPGPVRSPASTGTNQLLADGCGVVRDAADVLVALGSRAPTTPVLDAEREATTPPTDRVLQAMSWSPATVQELVSATGMGFDELSGRLTRLEIEGTIERTPDGYQRSSP